MDACRSLGQVHTALAGGAPTTPTMPTSGAAYVLRSLVSDGTSTPNTDPSLVNGWGIAFNPQGFVWVSDAGTSVTTIYNGAGLPVAAAGHTVVDIAKDPSGHATPTGQAFNSTTDGFQISAGGVTA